MSHRTTRADLTQSLGALRDYAQDLQRARFEDSSTKLRLVVNAGQRDATLRALTERLLTRAPREELDARLQGEGFDPPPGAVAGLAFAYALLLRLKQGEKLDLRALLARDAFRAAGPDMEARWSAFKGLVVEPLLRGLGALLGRIEALPEGDLDQDQVYDQALAELAGEDAAAPAPAAASAVAPPLVAGSVAPARVESSGALAQLQERVRSLRLGSPGEEDLLLDARILGVELGKHAPDPERLAELVGGLAEADRGLLAPALALVLETREGDLAPARRAFQEAPTRRIGAAAEEGRPKARTGRVKGKTTRRRKGPG